MHTLCYFLSQDDECEVILDAAADGDADIITLLAKCLTNGAARVAAAGDGNWRSPLHKAAYFGHDNVVEALLTLPNIDVNASHTNGHTPLHYATFGNHCDVVDILLAVPNIQVNAADRDGFTPLYSASFRGHEDLVKAFLAVPNIDVNGGDDDGWAPLYGALFNGQTNVAKLLLAAPNFNVNGTGTTDDRCIPLHSAAIAGCVETVETLLEH